MQLSPYLKMAFMLGVGLLVCPSNLLIAASKENRKSVPYSSATVILLTEVTKLTIALGCVIATATSIPTKIAFKDLVAFALPASLYAVDNNLTFTVLRYLDPASVAVLWNLRIVATAILFRLVFHAQPSSIQNAAILLLVLGAFITQSDHATQKDDASEAVEGEWTTGILLLLTGIMVSSFASVYAEWTLKTRTEIPFVWQNVILYTFGVLFNSVGVFTNYQDVAEDGFFHDYNYYAIAIILVDSLVGIAMAALLKYMDNIACIYSHALAMIFTALFSIVFFSFSLSLDFVCGLGVILTSLYLYHAEGFSDENSTSSSSKTTETENELDVEVQEKGERNKYLQVADQTPEVKQVVVDE